MRIKRRFIAGAKCEHCNAVDTMQLTIKGHTEYVECVECHNKEYRPTEANKPQHEEVQVVTVLPEGRENEQLINFKAV